MKPLFPIVVAILVIAANAHPENIEDVKELPQSNEPVLEAQASEPQARAERCTACSGTLSLKSPKEFLAALKNSPNAEVHTQETFEGCSSEKGCAGLKVKDGKVVEKFGNLQAFQAAANANKGNEFQFHAAGNSVFEGGAPNGGPFWWMNQDSPFKAGASGGGGSFEKFSKSSSSFTSSSNGGAGGVDLAANPFLNGGFAKLAGSAGFNAASGAGFNGASGAGFNGATGAGFNGAGGKFSSQSFESSSTKEIDISKNPFLNGGVSGAGASGFGSQSSFGSNSQSSFGSQGGQAGFGAQAGQAGFGAQTGQGSFGAQTGQGAFGAQGSQSGFGSSFNANKFSSGSGFVGSSPAPFAPAGGANVNLIQNSQKKFDYEQQQQTQQNIDEAFQSTGNVNAHDNSGGDLQQTCAGQGYVCVHKSQCNNGVVNTNGGALHQANTQKQYCNTRTEICCRIETASLAGSNLQGSLGIGSGTFQGSTNNGQGQFSQSGQSSQNSFTSQSSGSSGFNANANKGSASFGTQFGSGSAFNSNKFGSTASGFGTTAAPNRFGTGFQSTTQSNFVETDSFSAGSENAGVFRPGAVGSGLKPGIPYLPPVDNTNSGSNIVTSSYTPSFVTTPRPFSTPRPTTPRPITPRPVTTGRPTYLPPSTKAPEYLPPIDGITASESFNNPYITGGLILDQTRPQAPQNNDIPVGCAAALKCTPIEYCTAEGVISNTTVALTRDQAAYRVPLTDCKDLETGRVGKCCRDPFYTDPWPANQLGKWVPGVFGGNDGKYVGDNRGSPNNPPGVTVRPPVTGGVILNNFRTEKPTPAPGSYVQKNQFGQGQVTVQGQGQYESAGQGNQGSGGSGQYGQGSSYFQTSQGFGQGQSQGGGQIVTQGGGGQIVTQGGGQLVSQGGGQLVSQGGGQLISQGGGSYTQKGQGTKVTQGVGFDVTQGGGQIIRQGQGFEVSQGGGQIVSQGFGTGIKQGQGQYTTQGFGTGIRQGQGQYTIQGQGQYEINGQGQKLVQGGGQIVTQGFGTGIKTGQGFGVSQSGGFGYENEFGESVQRVYLPRYTGSGECGILNPQKPYGNRKDLEVDFAEIPWQAMILHQADKSLLCGGVITRPDVVITSASCVEGLEAKNVLIKGGEWKLGIDEEPLPFQIVQVKTILRHPGFKAGSYINDVAILVLTENLRLAKNIWPICLPSSTDTLDGFYNGAGECMVTGWGKSVLQAHLLGSIMHSMNVSLLNPGECQSKITQDYPHLQEYYDQDSCVCGQPTNPANNICKVDIGSALACTTGDNHFVLRGIYSLDSGCQAGNQLATFYKFDLEWYEWAIGLIESVRFSQYTVTKVTSGKIISQVSGTKGTFGSGIKTTTGGGVKGTSSASATAISGSGVGVIKGFGTQGQSGQYQFSSGSSGSSGIKGSLSSGQGSGIISGSGSGLSSGSGIGVIKGFGTQGQQGQYQFTSGSSGSSGIKGSLTSGQGSGIISGSGSGLSSGSGIGVIKGFGTQGQSGQYQFTSGSSGSSGIKGSLTSGQGSGIISGSGSGLISGSGIGVIKGFGTQGQSGQYQITSGSSGSTGIKGSVASGQGSAIISGSGSGLSSGSGSGVISGSGVGVIKGFGTQGQSGQYQITSGSSGIKGSVTSGQGSGIVSGSGSGLSSGSGSGLISGSGVGVIKGFGTQGQSGQYTFTSGSSGSSGVKGTVTSGQGSGIISGSGSGLISGSGQSGQFGQFGIGKFGTGSGEFSTEIKGPIQNTFSATYSEKKFFQSEPKYEYYTTKPEIVTFTTKPEYFTYTTKPKIITYTTKPEIVTYTTKPEIVTFTTKPEIVTYTTKPEIFTYTTKPKIVTYTTKPQVIRYDYQTSGSQTNQQVVAPSSFNPSFTEVVGAKHAHDGNCKCLEGKK